jgi:vacuolar protein sorting-associated protein 26
MSYFFATPVDIDIVLEDGDDRSMVDVKLDKNRREKAPLFMDGESVKGAVTIRPKDGKRLEHTGIKVQFIGTIGMALIARPRGGCVGGISSSNLVAQ